jgi:hypothetical protein
MPNRSSKLESRPEPLDVNQIAASIVAQLSGESLQGRDPLAVALGRRGGLKGGPARAKRLSKAKRHKIAQKAAKARWNAKK